MNNFHVVIKNYDPNFGLNKNKLHIVISYNFPKSRFKKLAYT